MIDLSAIELFKDFTVEEQQSFKDVVKEVPLRKGEPLFNEGDPGDALYIISSGAIRIFKNIKATGEDKSLALLSAGTYLGEMTLMDGTPRSASARAESDSLVLKISRDDFTKLLGTYPQSAVRLFVSFMRVLSDRLRRTNEELVALYEVGKVVSGAPPLNELLGGILKTLTNGAKVKLGIIFAINEFAQTLEVREALGEKSIEYRDIKFKSGEGIVGLAIKKKDILHIWDFDISDEYRNLKRFGFERANMIIAPLIRQNQPFGAILLADRDDEKPFDNADINLVQAVAAQAAAAVETALFHRDCIAKEEYDRKYFQF